MYFMLSLFILSAEGIKLNYHNIAVNFHIKLLAEKSPWMTYVKVKKHV